MSKVSVSQEDFHYDYSGLYVETEHVPFTREPSHSLYSLLIYTPPPPVLTKAGKVAKKQPPPYKDRSAAFYSAQLIHYGLKKYKMRDPAKKHLLQAFDANHELKVPEHILRIERELKEQYGKARVAAQKAWEEENRKRNERLAKEREERDRKKAAILKELSEIEKLDIAAISDGEDGAIVKKLSEKALREAVKTMPEEELRKVVGKIVKNLPELREAIEMQVSKSQKRTKKPSKGKAKATKLANDLTSQEFKGRFNVSIPFMSESWSQYERDELFTLTLSPSSTSAHLWGHFEFGGVSGIMRSTNSTPIPESFPVGQKVHFQWRGAESGEGETTFSKSNTVYIVFLGGGRIKGHMCWDLGNFSFTGKRDEAKSQNVVWVKYVSQWKSEWRGYNEHNYGVASRARWGSWGGDPRDEDPATSDTSDGKGGSEEGDEDEDMIYDSDVETGYRGYGFVQAF